MRNLPRLALVPLAVLIWTVPFTFTAFVGPAGADTVADCEAAFNSGTTGGLTYTTDPAVRLAYTGQSVGLYGAWDPAAWDSLTSATACVRVDDRFDDVLGVSEPTPDNGGAFSHAFVIPDDTEPGTRLCTKIRLAGDPAGEATEAVWSSRMHCFEVDHHEEEAPPSEDETTPTTGAPSTTTSTAPADSPANSQGGAGDEAPPASSPAPEAPASPPFDSAGDVPGPGGNVPAPSAGATPESLPLLPATGYTSLHLLHHGELLFFTGLGLLVLGGRRRRQLS